MIGFSSTNSGSASHKSATVDNKGNSMDFGLIFTVLSALATGIASVYNTVSTKETNDENREYADAMTTAQWDRDDRSFQRQVEDAKMAGLSPLAVTGYAPSSTPVTSFAQAPQMDLSSFIGALSSAQNYDLGIKNLDESKRQFDATTALETYKAQEAVRQLQEQIDQTALEHQEQVKQFVATLEYQYDVLNDQIDTHINDTNAIYSSEFQKAMQQASADSLKSYEALCNTLKITPPVEYYTDFDLYIKALNEYPIEWNKMLFKSDTSSSSYSFGDSDSSSVNVGANVTGTGISVGGSDSTSQNYASSHSDDYTRSNSVSVLPMNSDGKTYKKFPVFKYKPSEVNYSTDSHSKLKHKYK